MKKTLLALILLAVMIFPLCLQSCDKDPDNPSSDTTVGWDGKSVTYKAEDIKKFGSATPAGMVNDNGDGSVAIWNTDPSLDNYGGVQTPALTLDFSKAVIFKMNVVSCYSQYIVKLAVEGESEYYYVLSDEGTTGEISVNVVDAMLCDKYRGKNTQPDPGYQNGWKFDDKKKNCAFHILAKGPDGEQNTAELNITEISVFNDETAVTGITVTSDKLNDGVLTALKNSEAVTLSASVSPSSISDKSVTWKSLDESVAAVNADGRVSFVGVGVTQIVATSKIDQSKSSSVKVNVISGYEDKSLLTAKLNGLTYNGSASDAALFDDLFKTSWAGDDDMKPTVNAGNYLAVDARASGSKITMRNHFDGSSEHINEANGLAASDGAYLPIQIAGANGATVYRNIGGKLFRESSDGQIQIQYLSKQSGNWTKASNNERIIIVFADGSVKKLSVSVVSSIKIADYNASDFTTPSLWTIPDRTKQSENRVVHALSPASVRVENGVAIFKQNKYPEAKYCFGGIVSNVLTVDKNKRVEILLDVDSLNKMNDYVKTMWELKIIYYAADGATAVSANPLKLESGNVTGLNSIVFTPAYDKFAIYLVVNGSDIGAQFSDAEMKIKSMQIYSLD